MGKMMIMRISLTMLGASLLMYAAATEGLQLFTSILGGGLIGVGVTLE